MGCWGEALTSSWPDPVASAFLQPLGGRGGAPPEEPVVCPLPGNGDTSCQGEAAVRKGGALWRGALWIGDGRGGGIGVLMGSPSMRLSRLRLADVLTQA